MYSSRISKLKHTSNSKLILGTCHCFVYTELQLAMGIRCFSSAWLDKVDANNQVISLWCMKKEDYTAICKLCYKDISTVHGIFSFETTF